MLLLCGCWLSQSAVDEFDGRPSGGHSEDASYVGAATAAAGTSSAFRFSVKDLVVNMEVLRVPAAGLFALTGPLFI